MSKKHYYYHPSYGPYLDALENFAKCCGGISRELALLFELNATKDNCGNIHPEQISEDWQRVFYDRNYYGGSLKALKESIEKKRTGYKYKDKATGEMIEVDGTDTSWRKLRSAARAAGIKIVDKKADDPEAWARYGRFYDMLTSLESVCDLRAMLYGWIRSDRKKIADGQATITPNPALVADKNWKPIETLSIEEIFKKYDELLEKRKKAGK